MKSRAAIVGCGVWTPKHSITNEKLAAAYNAYADQWNAENVDKIEAGDARALKLTSAENIVKTSGIERRYVVEKAGILDPKRMAPRLAPRANDAPSIMAEMAINAASQALEMAQINPARIDLVLCAASNMERAYPSIAVEVQDLLGAPGFAFDMNAACSSATFAVQAAADMIKSGSIETALIVNPEICSAHLEWRDRDCNFIFGDAASALVLQRQDLASVDGFTVRSTRAASQFSNNIRNNNGFLRGAHDQMHDRRDMLFMQNGRRVFKEVLPMVVEHISQHLADEDLKAEEVERFWLHQANKFMNEYIGKELLGRPPTERVLPVILNEYANTSSAGSIIAFAKHSSDMRPGQTGLMCSFGAGYTIGSVIVERFVASTA